MRENHTPRMVDLSAERLRRRGLDDSRRETTTEDSEGQLGELIHPFKKMQGRSRRPTASRRGQNSDKRKKASIFVLPDPLTVESHNVDNGDTTDDALGAVALAEVVRLDDYRNPGYLEEILRRQRMGDFEARRGALRGHDEVRWPKREPRDTDIFDDWI